MSRSSYHKGALKFDFVALPKAVLKSAEWCDLPPGARILAIDLAAQYTGKNNGRLTPAFEAMQQQRWVSKGTLIRAKKALLEASFIVLTRKGHAPRTAEWVGFTWWPLNFEPSMDVDPKYFPYLNFQTVQSARIDPNRGRENATGRHLLRSRNETDTPPKTALRGTKTRPTDSQDGGLSVSKEDHTLQVNDKNAIGLKTGHVLEVAISAGRYLRGAAAAPDTAIALAPVPAGD